MYADLCRPAYYYLYKGGGAETIVAPENYVPVTLIEPELTAGEWREDQEGLTKSNSSTF